MLYRNGWIVLVLGLVMLLTNFAAAQEAVGDQKRTIATDLTVQPNVIATTTTLDFEDIAIGTIGFSSKTIDGVNFTVPSGQAIYGSAANTQPFVSQSINLWTFGSSGLTITFPFAVSYVSFDAGEITPIQEAAVDQLSASGLTPFDFTLSHTNLSTVVAVLPTPQSSIQILFQSGTESLLGMDNLTFSTVPEPSSIIAMAIAVGLVGFRRKRRETRRQFGLG